MVIDPNTGLIDLSASTPGIHYVYNSIGTSGTCAASIDDDTISINPIPGCSSYTIANVNNSQFWGTGCTTDSIHSDMDFYYENLTAGTATITVNWGDGITSNYTYPHGAGSGYVNLSGALHLYSTPGAYTILCKFNDPSACYNDSLVQTIDVNNLCGNLTGTIFIDANSNCTLDNGEIGVPYVQVSATMGNYTYYSWTDFMGNYTFENLPLGSFAVQVDNIGFGYSITCNNSLPHNETIVSGNITTANFAATCGGMLDVAVTGISLMNGFYPGGNDAVLPHVGVLNAACNTTPIAGQVKIILDACIQYTTSGWTFGNAPDAVITASTGDTLVWNVADINNIGNFNYFDYPANVSTCTSAQVGDTACITVMVIPSAGDADLSNNTFSRCFAIGVAYDPNSKEVSPTGVGSAGYIAATTPSLEYTINFQNTGTALAHNIYVLDTISANLDINSIEILSASHRLKIYTLPNRVIKFMFADILLPDSTSNELLSHGYVTFKIKLNSNLSGGTQVKNTGYIYFDYNEPVVTNTTLNTIDLNAGVHELGANATELQVYPNPATEKVIVATSKNSPSTITITDLLGKTVKEIKTSEMQTEVNVSDMQGGVYFIKLTQDNISHVKKVVVNK